MVTTADSAISSKTRWTIVGLLSTSIAINLLDRQIFSVLAPLLRETFTWSNTQYGYTAAGFGSARSALLELRTFNPDVVISDVSMPFMNGWELAREIRHMMGERPTLIGISGQYMRGPDKVLAELAGFNFYLTKPCDPKELMALLAPLAGKPCSK